MLFLRDLMLGEKESNLNRGALNDLNVFLAKISIRPYNQHIKV